MATTHDTARNAHAQDMRNDAAGTVDATNHKRTFDGFVKFLAWNVAAIAVVLIFLALANS
ncbi:aa3-type cytochrome c oxidase subunit IV [Paracoccus sp. Z118]|uniref:aa3-type cytochrome c oxidase subunit IV n=1 Tax=Paracoccus sp. Z118 TaxID=2851017 RepID=UPI0020B645A8|nr:aa3-type cytochrome c oxidase subunit IV [Paracoccus sp. Z118]